MMKGPVAQNFRRGDVWVIIMVTSLKTTHERQRRPNLHISFCIAAKNRLVRKLLVQLLKADIQVKGIHQG